MRKLQRFLTLPILLLPISSCAYTIPASTRHLFSRNIVETGQSLASSYDFVIVGGGTAGLALASRLSEDANKTVLVLEAGDTGDAVKGTIDVPGNAYYSSLLGSTYDWSHKTVPQPHAGNRVITWPGGKVLGGSSAVNGMYLVRPNQVEVDAWSSLMAGQDSSNSGSNSASSSTWNWESMFAAMKKSETFTPPSPDIQQAGNIQYDISSHGTTGPLHYSYPGYIVPVVGTWTSTLNGIGIPPSPDANSGKGWGAFIATSSINPSNWTRSYSRSAYVDPLPPRPNLAILPNAQATRLIFGGSGLNVTAVEYASAKGQSKQTVNVNKEVIITSGPIGSPQLLMASGVGPRDVLEAAGVKVVNELPGVGQHLQDHLSTQVVWQTTEQTAASIHQSNATQLPNGTSSPFLSFVNSAIAYVNITDLLGSDSAPQFQQQISSTLDSSVSSGLVPSQYPEVVAGYKAIYQVGVQKILMSPVGQVEILFNLMGTAVGGSQSIAIQAALQHPFSQGRMYINSSDVFDPPVIDPQYLSHPADTVMLREGLKLARKLGQTDPLKSAMVTELSPGSNVTTDDDWDNWLAGQVSTEFHPSCTCAMLPKNLGGVVDANLRVYGLGNVRVADSSIFPIQFAAHLLAPTYGLAEQAANIIRAQYNGVPLPSSNTNTTPKSTHHSSAVSSLRINSLFGGLATTTLSVVASCLISAAVIVL